MEVHHQSPKQGPEAASYNVRKRQDTRHTPDKMQPSEVLYPMVPPRAPNQTASVESLMDESAHIDHPETPDPSFVRDPISPIYPDDPNHPLHGFNKELSYDSRAILADQAHTPPPRSLYDAKSGIFDEEDISDDHLLGILQQHSKADSQVVPPHVKPTSTVTASVSDIPLDQAPRLPRQMDYVTVLRTDQRRIRKIKKQVPCRPRRVKKFRLANQANL